MIKKEYTFVDLFAGCGGLCFFLEHAIIVMLVPSTDLQMSIDDFIGGAK